MVRFWLIVSWAFFVCGFIQPLPIHASPLEIEKAYFEDPTGTLGLSDVATKSLTPFSGRLEAGFGSSVYWVRLMTPKPLYQDHDRRHTLILRVLPIFIDEITVFQTCDGKTNNQHIGDQYPIADQAYPALSLNLFLEPCALTQPIWLRIKSTSARNADIEIMPVDEAIQLDFQRFMFIILGASIVLFLLLLIAIYDSPSKDPLLLVFALQQVTLLAVILINTGVVRISFDIQPAFYDRMSSFATVLVELALLGFNLFFLSHYRVSKLLKPVTYSMMALTIFNLVLVFTPWRGTAMFLNVVILSISIVFFFLMTLTICKSSSENYLLPPKLVVLYFGIITAFILPPLLSFFGFGQSFAPDIATAYAFFTTLVMSSMLITRARRRAQLSERERLEMAVDLQKMKQEQKFRDQQEQLFTMLVHEVKTPIAALKIAMSNATNLDVMRAKAARHLDTVTTIINHCNQAYRLEDPAFKISSFRVNLSKMLEKAIADHDIDIRIEPAVPDDLEIDPQLFQAIASNLIDNATRYKAVGTVPQLIVGLERRAGRSGLLIEVNNDVGVVGLPDERQLFRKYYRSSNAHHTSGSGLGLFLAHASAARLGGELTYIYDDKIRFRLWLPL